MSVALRSYSNTSYAGSNSCVIPPPAGLTDNDILLALLFVGGSNGNETPLKVVPPAGFTEVGTYLAGQDNSGFVGLCYVFWKRAASESGSYTFAIGDGTIPQNNEGLLLAFSGAVNVGSPVDASSQNNGSVLATSTTAAGTQSTQSTALSITTTVDHDMIVHLVGDWGDLGSITAPPGYTTQFDNVVLYCSTMEQASAGPTGNVVVTCNSSAEPWFGFLVALMPETGATQWNDTAGLGSSEQLAVSEQQLMTIGALI